MPLQARKLTKDSIGAGAYDTDSWVLKLVSFVAGMYTPLSNSSKNFLTIM